MKAAQFSEYGGPSAIQVTDIDKPSVGDGQVLVEVHASSINPFDSKIMSGAMKDNIPLDLPVTLGGDIAGVVVEPGDSEFSEGGRVYGQANAVAGNSGAFAEFATTKASQIAVAPNDFSFNEIASLPLVGVSALQALTVHLDLQADQKLFIHGGAGGIGSMAIQIAKNIGAYVAVTATGDDMAYVSELGADEIIDYKEKDFSEELSNFDAVFDMVGGDETDKSFKILKSGGKVVSMVAEPDEAKAKEAGITAFHQFTKVTTEMLNKLRELVESGIVNPQVDQVFDLENISEAFEAKESGRSKGKIVIKIK